MYTNLYDQDINYCESLASKKTRFSEQDVIFVLCM